MKRSSASLNLRSATTRKPEPRGDVTSRVIMARSTRTEIVSGGETAEKREPQYTVGGNIHWCGHSGTQYGGSSKKKKIIELPYDPAVSTSGYISEENKNTYLKRCMHPNVHSSIIYNSQDMEMT